MLTKSGRMQGAEARGGEEIEVVKGVFHKRINLFVQ